MIPPTTSANTDAHSTRLRYQPFFCEENAWWLCAEPALGPGSRWVMFSLSHCGALPLAAQRAVAPGQLCWWDYHVVVLDSRARIWDLDTRLGLPVSAPAWLAGTFPFIELLPPDLTPLFRVVPADDYRASFASDRSHMRHADGGWQQPPPPWPPIGTGMTLPAFCSTTPGGPGTLMEWAQLLQWLERISGC